jgi:tetratricopeptide (TPR) repeat protein
MRGTTWAVALAVAMAVAALASARLDRAALAVPEIEPVYLPKADYLRPMSLGWRNALANVLWFRTISYFGAHYRGDHTYPWLAAMCELVTDLDPRAEHVYRFAGVILPWEANQVDAGIALLQKGLRQFPDDWMLHYHLGFHYYFFKNDIDTALSHLREAMALPGVHPAIARLAAVLAQHQYGPETTLAFLQELADNVDSREVRGVVEEHMREARLAADLEHLQAAVDTYRQRTGAVPPSLQALVDAGLLADIPRDPFASGYELDPATGAVRSASGRVPSALHASRMRERALRGESVREP